MNQDDSGLPPTTWPAATPSCDPLELLKTPGACLRRLQVQLSGSNHHDPEFGSVVDEKSASGTVGCVGTERSGYANSMRLPSAIISIRGVCLVGAALGIVWCVPAAGQGVSVTLNGSTLNLSPDRKSAPAGSLSRYAELLSSSGRRSCTRTASSTRREMAAPFRCASVRPRRP